MLSSRENSSIAKMCGKDFTLCVLCGIEDAISSTLQCLLLGLILSSLISSNLDKTLMYAFAVYLLHL